MDGVCVSVMNRVTFVTMANRLKWKRVHVLVNGKREEKLQDFAKSVRRDDNSYTPSVRDELAYPYMHMSYQ